MREGCRVVVVVGCVVALWEMMRSNQAERAWKEREAWRRYHQTDGNDQGNDDGYGKRTMICEQELTREGVECKVMKFLSLVCGKIVGTGPSDKV